MGKPLTKLQKKYIDRMMNSKVKKTNEFEKEMKKESFDSQMKYIKKWGVSFLFAEILVRKWVAGLIKK